MPDVFLLLKSILAGTLASCVLGCLPALHIYNVAGILVIFHDRVAPWFGGDPLAMAVFMMSLIVGYSFINTVPSIFWGAPDESTAFLVLPSHKYLFQGRGYEAAVLTGVGSLAGVAILILLTPFFFHCLPSLKALLMPHMAWILMTIIAYMLLSEFPKSYDRGDTPLQRLLDAYKSVGAGLLTFFLSAFLGILVLNKNLVPLGMSFQGIMPAFVGLFAVPWVVGNIMSRTPVPEQRIQESVDLDGVLLLRGSLAGSLGGLFAAFFPIVTAGIGALLAGHATAQQDDRLFILSYGTNKVLYYVGSFLLFFVPVLGLTRGGMAIMMSPFFRPAGYEDYFTALGAVALSGALSFFLLLFFSALSVKVVNKVDYRVLSWAALVFIFALVGGLTGWMGLFVMIVASAIGFIPVLFDSRRSNCMGILLLPIALNMAGYGPAVLSWLGLD